MEIDKENLVQAVVVMDTFNNNLSLITNDKPLAFLPVGGVLLIAYVLNYLALGGVNQVILFCCQDGVKIKEYIRDRVRNKELWSLTMDVQVMTSETCQTMGDVMREIDAAAIIRGHFVLTGINTITNINFATLLEQHKQLYKKDKGAAMTLVYKEVAWDHPLITSDNPTFLAADAITNKVLIHQKYKPKSKDNTINLHLEKMLNHSGVKLHHNLIDANIALCSPSVLQLFCDNIDFQTRDDFIHGLLINEEILASSLYYTLVKPGQYAAAVTNWRNYKIICRDTIHDWVYPLTIETGRTTQENMLNYGYHIFRDNNSMLNRSCTLKEDVLICGKTVIGANTVITNSVIGEGCNIGANNIIDGSHIMNNVIIQNNCDIINSFIDDNCDIGNNNIITNSAIGKECDIVHNNFIEGSHIMNNVIIQNNCDIRSRSVIEEYCAIGNNNIIERSHIMNNVMIKNNCNIINYFIDKNRVIENNSNLVGVILASNVNTDAGSNMKGNIIQGSDDKVPIFTRSRQSCPRLRRQAKVRLLDIRNQFIEICIQHTTVVLVENKNVLENLKNL